MEESNLWLLDQLVQYNFLTVSQFRLLERRQSDKTLYQRLQMLRETGMIGTLQFGYHPSYGRREDMHYPKKKAYSMLERGTEKSNPKLYIPNKQHRFLEDYDHRKMTIDCQIMINLSEAGANSTLPFYEHYFQRKKSRHTGRFERSTKIHLTDGFIIPDSIFQLKNHLYCVELHRGYRVKKIENQLKQYAHALASGAIADKYMLESNPIILTVFEKKSTMLTTMERMLHESFFMYVKPYYLFKCYDDLMVNPLDHRVTIDQQVRTLPGLDDQIS